MAFYLCVFLICFIVLLRSNNTKGLVFAFVLLTLVSCCRGINVGVDTPQFCAAYEEIGKSTSWDFTSFRYEAGFFYLCKILNLFSHSYRLLIIVTSLLINISVFLFIKRNSYDFMFSTMTYLLFNCFFSSMNLMRQWLALSIVMLGFRCLTKKKYAKYILICLLASLFHKVAVSALLLIPFKLLKSKKAFYIALIAAFTLVFFFANETFNFLAPVFGYVNYIDGEFTSGNNFGSYLLLIEHGFILLLSYWLHKKWCNTNGVVITSNHFSILMGAGILHCGFLLLSSKMVIFNRFSEFFSMYLVILIPEIFKLLKMENYKDYNKLRYGSIGVFLVCFIVISLFRPEWYGCLPYGLFIG